MRHISYRPAVNGCVTEAQRARCFRSEPRLKPLAALVPALALGTMVGLVQSAAAQQESNVRALEEVIVTARRQAENVQATPLSITALTPDVLAEAGITEVRDLTVLVPGVNLTLSGSSTNTVFSIRGRSKGTVGNVQPSVATYVNEVPVSSWGASLPTYDLAGIEILKGPQGTLFGRNATVGAVLLSTAQPEWEFGGYLQATGGSYDWREVEGAVNIPLLADKVALRVAGQIARRDGYTDNMSFPNNDMDDMHRDNFRISLLIAPTDSLSNTTVYERTDIDETPGSVLYGYNPSPTASVNQIPWTNGTLRSLIPMAPCAGDPACDVRANFARQQAAGERKAWTDMDVLTTGKTVSANNTTVYEGENFTVKNILGYRAVEFHNAIEIDGTDMAIINADSRVASEQFSEELQIAGDAFDDRLNYVGGLFYLKSEPDGENYVLLQQFAITGTPLDSTNTTRIPPIPVPPFLGALGSADYYTDESRSVYGQISYDLGAVTPAFDGLTVDIGARYTEDEQEVCNAAAQLLGVGAASESQCESATSPQYTRQSAEFEETTWNLGLNYAVSNNFFVYGAVRKGYRGGGINTPVFDGILQPYQTYEPETVQDIEIGMKTDFSVQQLVGRFNLALFRSEFDQLQAGISGSNLDGDGNPLNEPANNTFYANVGEATVEGVEAELTVSPLNNLELTAAGAYLDKQIDKYNLPTGFPLTEGQVESYAFLAAPRYSYNFSAEYIHPLGALGDLTFTWRYFRISDVQYGSVEANAYDRQDLRLAWSNVAQTELELAAFVHNLEDTAGVAGPTGSTGIGINAVSYIAPRMYGVQARYQF